MIDPETYLRYIEEQSAANGVSEHYLWPRTALSNLQAEAMFRVGVSDWREDDLRSRPAQIIKILEQLLYSDLLNRDFTVLDICCGDAVVLWQIKRAFPKAQCYGLDLNAGQIDTHAMVQEQGVKLFRATIQRLFADTPDVLFDVCMMLNTYRGWESADLQDNERWIPDTADEWFRQHARYTILTVSKSQVEQLKDRGFWVSEIGKGEDDSWMVLVFPCGDRWKAER